MTEAPPPDADGYWHYTYVTYHPDTGEWYGGKHTTKNLNDGYRGSGSWVRNHPARAELVMEVVEFFYSEDHAYAAEAALVTLAIIATDPLCRNELSGGLGISRDAARRLAADPEWRRKTAERNRLFPTDPEWRRRHQDGITRLASDPAWQRKNREVLQRIATDPVIRHKRLKAMSEMHLRPEYRRDRLAGWEQWAADPEAWQKHLDHLARTRATSQWKLANAAKNTRQATNPEWLRKMRGILVERNQRLATDPEWLRKVHKRNANPEYQRKKREGLARYHAKKREEKLAAG